MATLLVIAERSHVRICKMAAQWRRKDEHIITGNTDFLTANTFNEAVLGKGEVSDLEMDTHSCLDPSILAMFEDSAVAAETRSRLDEESEATLLTALTEILDSVDDETLSPFDTLPDTGLFSDQRLRDNSPLRRLLSLTRSPPDKEALFRSIKTPSSSSSPSSSVGKVETVITDRPRRARLTPRAQGSSTSIQRSDGEEEERSDTEEEEGGKVHIHSPPRGFNLTNQDSGELSLDQSEVRALNSVEKDHGYSSTVSLVDLVKLMHPYCLRVCLDEEGKDWIGTSRQEASSLGEWSADQRVPLEGEVWRYTKPGSEESDEEIDVDGSDDECPSGGGIKNEKGGDGEQGSKGEEVKQLKSLLVKWDGPKEGQKTKNKKRVSFGPVLVTSYELPETDELDLNVLPDLSELTSQIPIFDFNTKTMTISLTTSSPESSAASSKDNQHPVETGLPERTGDKSSEPPPQQGESKPRPALSLQQYRLLRQQKRLPLVVKPENYTTKWPSLPETPKELPPIPYLQGPKYNVWGPTTTHHYIGSKTGDDVSGFKPISKTRTKIVSPACPSKPGKGIGINGSKPVRSGTKTSPASSALKPKCSSMEAKSANYVGVLKPIWTDTISPASPLPSPNLNSNSVAGLGQNRTSPEKSAVAISSDPPNPVLVPLPGTRPSLDGFDRSHGTNQEKQEQEQSLPLSTTQESPAPKPKMVFCNRDPSLKSTSLLLEIQRRFSTKQPLRKALHTQNTAETMKQGHQPRSLSPRKGIETVPEGSKFSPSAPVMASPSSRPSVHPPTNAVVAPYPEMERAKRVALGNLPHVQLSTSPESNTCIQTPTCGTGIEATDLTSLLERFEETQAKEETESEPEGSPDRSPVRDEELSNNTQGMLTLLGAYLLSTQEKLCVPEPASFPELVNTLEPLRTPEPLRAPERCDTQEPLSTQNVLSTQEQAPAQPRWKPLTPVAPQRKQPATPKPLPPKAIQIIDPRPLPPKKAHPLPPKPPVTPPEFQTPVSFSSDHDYCLSQDQPGSNTTTLCSKRQTILTDHQPITNPSLVPGTQNSGKYLRQQQPMDSRTVPETELPSDSAPPSTDSSPFRTDAITAGETQEERTSPCIPSPPSPSPPARGRRSSRRYRTRSSCSDSSSRSPSSSSSSSSSSYSRSRSRSPPRKRFCPRRSESSSSSSCSSSVSRSPVPCRYRLPYPQSWNRSRSTSKSWTQSGSRSRSRSPTTLAYSRAQRWRDCYSSNNVRDSRKRKRQQDMRNQKLKAIDERRVVYVGRIQRTMMHTELRERFSLFGEVEECTLHFRDRGDHYGFVTFYNMKDAFAAIENGYKLRRPDELPFDLCFGGRRQFCKSTYADLDSNREEEDPTPAKSKEEELDFDTLLKQAQKGLKR